ncbi:hypothetical protein [Pseudomonas syringae]|uniref:hypothetical protein n=1 Tax=Pseudomonas syringae TaxID=317 RepID=UPI001BCE8831|nr:hypothetical protein [Pseudomonas syringae]QVI75552.1 hypothetical protein KHW13_00165 [Pseudomonas syringae]
MWEDFRIPLYIFITMNIFGILIVLGFRHYLKFKERLLEIEIIKMDDFRSHMERQSLELNKNFAASELRWREVNHLVLSGQEDDRNIYSKSRYMQQPSSFLRSHGVDVENITDSSNLVFMLTPFHSDYYADYTVVVEAANALGLEVQRGDEKASGGDIFNQILKAIISARVIVANITGRNPNVFYELGIAHALNKPVILVCEQGNDVPFDLQSKRIVFFDTTEELKMGITKALGQALAFTK